MLRSLFSKDHTDVSQCNAIQIPFGLGTICCGRFLWFRLVRTSMALLVYRLSSSVMRNTMITSVLVAILSYLFNKDVFLMCHWA
jgi:hypothetical protein